MTKSFEFRSALALAAGALLAAAPAFAQQAKAADAAAKAPATAKQFDATKVSHEGFRAMREIHAARLAIFDGETKQCSEALAKAMAELDHAAKDESLAKVKDDLIAIDGDLALADTFVPSPEKSAHIAKANEHFKNGKPEQGLAELRLGEIEVNFTRVLLPLAGTRKRLTDAIGLADQQKYYECNLVLKAAEDAIVVDSVELIEVPQAREAAPHEASSGKAEKVDADRKDGK